MECGYQACPHSAESMDRSRIAGSWCALFATCRSLPTRNEWRWNATTPKAREIAKRNRKRTISWVARQYNKSPKGSIIIKWSPSAESSTVDDTEPNYCYTHGGKLIT